MRRLVRPGKGHLLDGRTSPGFCQRVAAHLEPSQFASPACTHQPVRTRSTASLINSKRVKPHQIPSFWRFLCRFLDEPRVDSRNCRRRPKKNPSSEEERDEPTNWLSPSLLLKGRGALGP